MPALLTSSTHKHATHTFTISRHLPTNKRAHTHAHTRHECTSRLSRSIPFSCLSSSFYSPKNTTVSISRVSCALKNIHTVRMLCAQFVSHTGILSVCCVLMCVFACVRASSKLCVCVCSQAQHLHLSFPLELCLFCRCMHRQLGVHGVHHERVDTNSLARCRCARACCLVKV
jgi:hypothetical protein